MKKNNLSHTIYELYFLFNLPDSNEFIVSQFKNYFNTHHFEIHYINHAEEEMNLLKLIKSFLEIDHFYVVIYKIRKLKECSILCEIQNHLFYTYLQSLSCVCDKILNYIIYEKINACLGSPSVRNYIKANSFFPYFMDIHNVIHSIDFLFDEFMYFNGFLFEEHIPTKEEIVNSRNKKFFLIRDSLKRQCHNSCKPNLNIILKNILEEMKHWDRNQFPFVAMIQNNFQEIYVSLLKTIHQKSRCRKKTKPTLEEMNSLF